MRNFVNFTENIAKQEIAKLGATIVENLSDNKVTDFIISLNGQLFEMYSDSSDYFQLNGYELFPLN